MKATVLWVHRGAIGKGWGTCKLSFLLQQAEETTRKIDEQEAVVSGESCKTDGVEVAGRAWVDLLRRAVVLVLCCNAHLRAFDRWIEGLLAKALRTLDLDWQHGASLMQKLVDYGVSSQLVGHPGCLYNVVAQFKPAGKIACTQDLFLFVWTCVVLAGFVWY